MVAERLQAAVRVYHERVHSPIDIVAVVGWTNAVTSDKSSRFRHYGCKCNRGRVYQQRAAGCSTCRRSGSKIADWRGNSCLIRREPAALNTVLPEFRVVEARCRVLVAPRKRNVLHARAIGLRGQDAKRRVLQVVIHRSRPNQNAVRHQGISMMLGFVGPALPTPSG